MYLTGISPHTTPVGNRADAQVGRAKISLYFHKGRDSQLTVVLINKVTFDVIQLVNVSNIAYDSATDFYTITGSPTSGSYNAKTYNLQIIW